MRSIGSRADARTVRHAMPSASRKPPLTCVGREPAVSCGQAFGDGREEGARLLTCDKLMMAESLPHSRLTYIRSPSGQLMLVRLFILTAGLLICIVGGESFRALLIPPSRR